MKVARLYSFNDIRIEEMPVPRPGPGEALMKTRASGICSGDLMPWYIEKKAPLVLGHEPAGEIVEVGSRARGFCPFRPGDRVAVHHHAPCLKSSCPFCSRKEFVHCPTWKGSAILPGGISEYILIPEVNLRNDTRKLPARVGFEDAVLMEPLACVLKGLGKAGPRRGETALVIGLGAMGALHIMALKKGKTRLRKVIGADLVPWRLKKALSLGADEVIDASRKDIADELFRATSGKMAELVIAGPNSAAAMQTAIKCASEGGRVLLFTPAKPEEVLTLMPNRIYFKEIALIPSYSCGPDDTAAALEMIKSGSVRGADIITHRFPIEKTAEAFRLAARAKNSLKTVILFPS